MEHLSSVKKNKKLYDNDCTGQYYKTFYSLQVLHSRVGFWTSIRLDWKGLLRTNALAYYEKGVTYDRK